MLPKTHTNTTQLNIFNQPPHTAMEYSVGELTLHYKPLSPQLHQPVRITNSEEFIAYLRKYWFTPEVINVKEYLYAIFVNSSGVVSGVMKMSEGTRNQTLIDCGHLVVAMLLHNCTRVLLAHNHPSGVAVPSNHDYNMTEHVVGVLKTIGCELLEHLVLTERDWHPIIAASATGKPKRRRTARKTTRTTAAVRV